MSADAGELCHHCGWLLDRVLIAERASRHPACEQPAAPAGNADHRTALHALAAVFPTARLITDERTS